MERNDRNDRNDCNVGIVSDSRVLRKGLAALLKAHAGLRVVSSHSGLLIDPFDQPDGSRRSDTTGTSTAPSLLSVPNPPEDVVLLDGGLGREAVVAWTQHWRDQEPPAQVVVIEAPNEMDLILACIRAGAVGYVSRGAPLAEVTEAIDQVRRGNAHCSPEVAAGLFAWIAARDSGHRTYSYAYAQAAARTLSDTLTPVPEIPAIPAGRVIAVGPDGPALPDGAAVPRTGSMNQARPRLTHREMEIIGLIAEGCTNREIAEKLVIATTTVKNHVHNILGKLKLDSRRQVVTPPATQIGRVSDEASHRSSADWN